MLVSINIYGDLNLNPLQSNFSGVTYLRRHDENGTLEYVSEGCLALTGYQPTELTGGGRIAYSHIIHPADRDVALRQMDFGCRSQGMYDLIYRILTRNGQVRWVREIGRCLKCADDTVLCSEGMIIDITALKQTEGIVQRQMQRIDMLRQVDRAIVSSSGLPETLDVLLDGALKALDIDAASVLRVAGPGRRLERLASRGLLELSDTPSSLLPEETPAGLAALESSLVQIRDLTVMNGRNWPYPYHPFAGFRTYVAMPLKVRDRIVGVMEVFAARPLLPDPEWLNFLDALAGHGAVAFENARLYHELQISNLELIEAYDSTLTGWARVLEMRDQETEGHTQRVTQLTLQLAWAMNIPKNAIISIMRGALLHDIGKLGIPDRILLKPSPLTPDEWEIMRQHPEHARRLLASIPTLSSAIDIPYCHHERWDGTGYPRGLRGEGIPLAARIFAVADVWDALTSDRPYRDAWPHAQALAHIQEQSGKHFDPQVVRVFLKLIGEPA